MRKSELDRLLLNAVARAIGQPLPRATRTRRRVAAEPKRAYSPLPRTGAHHHQMHA